ncbi:unnamed protein product [Pleuronectes platessa]|uniref:Uncharacterized protein n=1 Tax=Pleuronectes platessa TaxID=8262 RepID=A0A9N7V2T3_PLEPL|nr:unnamed protein product [Pleuronectes platessa]
MEVPKTINIVPLCVTHWLPNVGSNTARKTDLQSETTLVRMTDEYLAMYPELAVKGSRQLENLRRQGERQTTLPERWGPILFPPARQQ